MYQLKYNINICSLVILLVAMATFQVTHAAEDPNFNCNHTGQQVVYSGAEELNRNTKRLVLYTMKLNQSTPGRKMLTSKVQLTYATAKSSMDKFNSWIKRNGELSAFDNPLGNDIGELSFEKLQLQDMERERLVKRVVEVRKELDRTLKRERVLLEELKGDMELISLDVCEECGGDEEVFIDEAERLYEVALSMELFLKSCLIAPNN